MITLKEGRTETLRFPEEESIYPPNADCLWTVVPHRFNHARLARISSEIKKFSTEANYDFLKVYESLERQNENFQALSGDVSSGEAITERRITSGLSFHFTSDDVVQLKGFKIKLELFPYDETCKEPEVVIYGGVYISNYSHTADYWCCSGYKIKGVSHRRCRKGAWLPNEKVACESRFNLLRHSY